MSRQLALPFETRAEFGAFLPGQANAAARAWVAVPERWPQGRLAIYGAAGTGKTHLLHYFAQARGGVFMPGEALRHLADLPHEGALAIDDADLAPQPEALLHVLNLAAERGLPVLLAGSHAPAHWAVALPDLASRLRATTAVALEQPEDSLLRALFAQLIAQHQLVIEPDLQDWLLARLPRHGRALRAAAGWLDRASLAARARVSRGMAQALLRDMGALDEDFETELNQASPAGPALF